MGGFGVFPAETVGEVTVVADCAATFAAGRPRDSIDGVAVGVEVREDVAALPGGWRSSINRPVPRIASRS